MTLQRAKGEDEEAELTYNQATLKFTYNRNAVSHKEWRRLRSLLAKAQAEPDNPDIDWIVPYLAQMLTSWDLMLDEKAKAPVPITAENLDMLPVGFLTEILSRIQETLVSPNQTPELNSGSSF
jgi:hypothetical protein